MAVGKKKITETKAVQQQAYILTNLLARPRCHGPRSNLLKNSLHKMGIQYDQSSAMAHKLKIAAIVM